MILDDKVKMTWNSNNKSYYESKGYEYTKMYEEFDILIEDLLSTSPKKVNVKCDVCGKIKPLKYREYNNSLSNGGYYSCSQKCSNGKSKNTCLKNYGSETFIQSKSGIEKIKNINLERYGVEYAIQNNEVKENRKKTCMERYGTDHVFQSVDIKKKITNTCLEKYGVDNASKSEEVKNKIRKTCVDKYGVNNAFKSNEVKRKIKETCLSKYGFEHHTQNPEIMKKIIDTQIVKYGEVWKNQVPKYNINSIIYLDIISDILKLPIQHALNGGEKKMQKYWIDGYIQKYNICIEWDEKGHRYREEYDINREDFLKLHNNCKFIRINEDEFLSNITIGIEKVINQIESLY